MQGQNPTSGGPGGLPATVAAAQALSAFPSAHPATIQVPDRRSIAPAGLPGLQLGSSIGLDLLGGFQLPGNLQAWLTAAPLGQIAGQGQQGSAAPLTGYLGTLGAGLQGIAPGIVVDTSSSALLAELLSAQAANATNGGVGPAGAGAPRGTLSQSSTRALDFSGQLPGAAPGGDAPAGGKPSGLPTRLFQQEDAAGSQGATTTPKAMLEGVGSGGLGNISAPNSGGPQPARRTRTLTTASGLPGLSSATPSQPPNGTSVVTSQHGTGISAMLPPLSGGAGRSGSGRPGDDWQGAGGGGGNRRTPPPSGYLERRAGSAAASDSDDTSSAGVPHGNGGRSRKTESRYDRTMLGSNLGSLYGDSNGPGLLGPGVGAPGYDPQKTCHCKKSQCLKLYCDCFAAGAYCVGCSCLACMNREEHKDLVVEKRKAIMQRDPAAFTRKIQMDGRSLDARHKKGCNCKRSHCLKKYCECYQGGVKCGDHCKCVDCQNQGDDSPPPDYPPPGPATISLSNKASDWSAWCTPTQPPMVVSTRAVGSKRQMALLQQQEQEMSAAEDGSHSGRVTPALPALMGTSGLPEVSGRGADAGYLQGGVEGSAEADGPQMGRRGSSKRSKARADSVSHFREGVTNDLGIKSEPVDHEGQIGATSLLDTPSMAKLFTALDTQFDSSSKTLLAGGLPSPPALLLSRLGAGDGQGTPSTQPYPYPDPFLGQSSLPETHLHQLLVTAAGNGHQLGGGDGSNRGAGDPGQGQSQGNEGPAGAEGGRMRAISFIDPIQGISAAAGLAPPGRASGDGAQRAAHAASAGKAHDTAPGLGGASASTWEMLLSNSAAFSFPATATAAAAAAEDGAFGFAGIPDSARAEGGLSAAEQHNRTLQLLSGLPAIEGLGARGASVTGSWPNTARALGLGSSGGGAALPDFLASPRGGGLWGVDSPLASALAAPLSFGSLGADPLGSVGLAALLRGPSVDAARIAQLSRELMTPGTAAAAEDLDGLNPFTPLRSGTAAILGLGSTPGAPAVLGDTGAGLDPVSQALGAVPPQLRDFANLSSTIQMLLDNSSGGKGGASQQQAGSQQGAAAAAAGAGDGAGAGGAAQAQQTGAQQQQAAGSQLQQQQQQPQSSSMMAVDRAASDASQQLPPHPQGPLPSGALLISPNRVTSRNKGPSGVPQPMPGASTVATVAAAATAGAADALGAAAAAAVAGGELVGTGGLNLGPLSLVSPVRTSRRPVPAGTLQQPPQAAAPPAGAGALDQGPGGAANGSGVGAKRNLAAAGLLHDMQVADLLHHHTQHYASSNGRAASGGSRGSPLLNSGSHGNLLLSGGGGPPPSSPRLDALAALAAQQLDADMGAGGAGSRGPPSTQLLGTAAGRTSNLLSVPANGGHAGGGMYGGGSPSKRAALGDGAQPRTRSNLGLTSSFAAAASLPLPSGDDAGQHHNSSADQLMSGLPPAAPLNASNSLHLLQPAAVTRPPTGRTTAPASAAASRANSAGAPLPPAGVHTSSVMAAAGLPTGLPPLPGDGPRGALRNAASHNLDGSNAPGAQAHSRLSGPGLEAVPEGTAAVRRTSGTGSGRTVSSGAGGTGNASHPPPPTQHHMQHSQPTFSAGQRPRTSSGSGHATITTMSVGEAPAAPAGVGAPSGSGGEATGGQPSAAAAAQKASALDYMRRTLLAPATGPTPSPSPPPGTAAASQQLPSSLLPPYLNGQALSIATSKRRNSMTDLRATTGGEAAQQLQGWQHGGQVPHTGHTGGVTMTMTRSHSQPMDNAIAVSAALAVSKQQQQQPRTSLDGQQQQGGGQPAPQTIGNHPVPSAGQGSQGQPAAGGPVLAMHTAAGQPAAAGGPGLPTEVAAGAVAAGAPHSQTQQPAQAAGLPPAAAGGGPLQAPGGSTTTGTNHSQNHPAAPHLVTSTPPRPSANGSVNGSAPDANGAAGGSMGPPRSSTLLMTPQLNMGGGLDGAEEPPVPLSPYALAGGCDVASLLMTPVYGNLSSFALSPAATPVKSSVFQPSGSLWGAGGAAGGGHSFNGGHSSSWPALSHIGASIGSGASGE